MAAADSLIVTSARLSPSRLNDFLGCEYRTHLDLEVAAGLEIERSRRGDAKLLQQLGFEHEERFLEERRAAGDDVLSLKGVRFEDAARQTREAMAAGRQVIHQATFMHADWVGQADFLVRVDEPSARWAWSYEVHDAKLARHPRPNYVFQLLWYSQQVERLQGSPVERMHLILGNGERPPFAPEDFDAYAARVVDHFLRRRGELAAGSTPAYPYRVGDCDFCPYWKHCDAKRRNDDHLSITAGLQRRQGVRLEDAGVSTMAALAALPVATHVPRLADDTLDGLRRQARLQIDSRELAIPLHELLEPKPERGFARLPQPSDGDVFFDFEGDPYFDQEGLQYLFGSLHLERGAWRYRPIWAHDRAGERDAFVAWVGWITERLERFPDMHVYHYANYERATLQQLMSRFGVCESEMDAILARSVLVDLRAVVRQAMRIGTEGYGLKDIECAYGFERVAEMIGGGGAARAYERWRESGDDAELEAVRAYNEEDVLSTLALRDWLLDRLAAAEKEFGVEIDALEAIEDWEPTDYTKQWLARIEPTVEALRADEDDAPRVLTAALLDYHRREAKPGYWAYYARRDASPDQLLEDTESIACLLEATDVGRVTEGDKDLVPLRFPSQDHKLGPGTVRDPATEANVTIADVDERDDLVWIERAPGDPLPTALIPGKPYTTNPQQDAVATFGERVVAHGFAPRRDMDAAADLVLRRPPRFVAGTPPLAGGELDLDRLGAQVRGLDESVLLIQGPPGTGKTWTGARLAVTLMKAGLRVGVCATSHKVINNLLSAVDEHAVEVGYPFVGRKKRAANHDDAADLEGCHNIELTSTYPRVRKDADAQLIGGTAWLFASHKLERHVDVLLIDEAGQVSLADAIAMSRGARSVVLLGDPQQLAHVSQGTHADDSGRSVLEHLLDGAATIAPDRGVFLSRTFRMNPAICSFVSSTMYDGRLATTPGLDLQTVDSPGLSGSGLRLLATPHDGNRQKSPEEAQRIRDEYDRLLAGGRWRDAKGVWHDLRVEDILVVAPYNAQVRCLKAHLPANARVGTVDKFQGQQAPVVFFSMASSSGDEVPRGMSFLFSRNRLNVAISRAQALTVVVCAPQLLWTRCGTVEDMRLVNMLCRFADAADG